MHAEHMISMNYIYAANVLLSLQRFSRHSLAGSDNVCENEKKKRQMSSSLLDSYRYTQFFSLIENTALEVDINK